MAPKTKTSTSPQSYNSAQSYPQLVQSVWEQYVADTPQRTKLLDAFMAFLLVVGGLQFAYCVIAGNFPFNAFLSGFGATVGQFVLTAALRIQSDSGNLTKEFGGRSQER